MKHQKCSLSTHVTGLALAALCAWAAAPALAQATAPAATPISAPVAVQNAWVRPTVPGQKGTGGFATFTSTTDAQLVSLSAAVAGVSEIHDMKMEANGTMRMFAVPALDLPAGKTVELKPGGLHLMLLDLKTALPKDSTVPVLLNFKAKDGKSFSQTVSFTVTPRAPAGDHSGHGAHKH